jgi:16S rRNA (cytidine1402-2'-O)-methyltransferase
MEEKGTLYLVGTPIGNLEDLSIRAARILAEADLIAAEDTRRTLKLMSHLGLSKSIVSYHEHNRRDAGQRLLAELASGRSVALVSDAGMPVVSDPGAELVAEAAKQGIAITVIPGPCAVSSALALSGMDGSRFVFEGFLPREGKPRKQALEALRGEARTVLFYEAPHRLLKTLKDLLAAMGDRNVAVCNDITKFYERADRVTLSAAVALFEATEPRGEYVLVLQGAEPRQECYDDVTIEDHVRRYIDSGMDKKEAVKQVAKDRGVQRNEVYSVVMDMDFNAK